MPVEGWNYRRDPVSDIEGGKGGAQAEGEMYFARHCVGFVGRGVVVAQLREREVRWCCELDFDGSEAAGIEMLRGSELVVTWS
jgi:hypothetical protein